MVVHRDAATWHDAATRDLVGHHGGLTTSEMVVPFAAVSLGTL